MAYRSAHDEVLMHGVAVPLQPVTLLIRLPREEFGKANDHPKWMHVVDGDHVRQRPCYPRRSIDLITGSDGVVQDIMLLEVLLLEMKSAWIHK